jgi:LmbE family N-acetylglucosaminyl deacetylase
VDPALSAERLASEREREQAEAADVLGVAEVIFLRRPDGELVPSLSLRREIANLLLVYRPDFVLAHDPWQRYQTHSEHRAR